MENILRTTRRQDTNVSDPERVISMVAGGSMLAYGLIRRDKPGIGLALLGSSLLYRGYTGHCDVYNFLGINTRDHSEQGTGTGVGVPYELGFRVDHTTYIDKRRNEVYAFWRKLENLPRFMSNLERVEVLDDRRSRWVAKAPLGVPASWEAEIINEVPGELIGWRSLPGSWVNTAGSVRFADAGNGTELSVSLQYNPPAGTLGRTVAKWLGDDPAEQIRHDVECFKELMETGAIAVKQSSSATPGPLRGGETKKNKMWDRDEVINASEESFPASDAPSWTPEKV